MDIIDRGRLEDGLRRALDHLVILSVVVTQEVPGDKRCKAAAEHRFVGWCRFVNEDEVGLELTEFGAFGETSFNPVGLWSDARTGESNRIFRLDKVQHAGWFPEAYRKPKRIYGFLVAS